MIDVEGALRNYYLECNYCGKNIKYMPCVMVQIFSESEINERDSLTDWFYFHKRCFKKVIKEEEVNK